MGMGSWEIETKEETRDFLCTDGMVAAACTQC
jgi:hypothetical protein